MKYAAICKTKDNYVLNENYWKECEGFNMFVNILRPSTFFIVHSKKNKRFGQHRKRITLKQAEKLTGLKLHPDKTNIIAR